MMCFYDVSVRVLLCLLSAYLLGSLVWGALYSRLRGHGAPRDLPGGSGTYRQYGLGAALLVVAGDMLKGVAAVAIAQRWAPGWAWAATFSVVLGHCYPGFFGFCGGGGGIAPLLGALMLAAPRALAVTLLLALLLMPLYKRFLQPRLGLNVIPAVTVAALPLGALSAYWLGGLSAVLSGGAAVALRALQWLLEDAWGEGKS